VLKKKIGMLVDLCHRYGTPRFVGAGGGNVSWKNTLTLWIKASGTYLSEVTEATLVAVRREPLAKLFQSPVPEDSSEREAWAKQIIQQAVEDDWSNGRPSVETPLHDLFDAAYVVHTHPPLVNGLTCSKNAESAWQALFPEALWVSYVDPGVTLFLQVKQQFKDYIRENGQEPSVIVMQNHGLVVAADELAEIDLIHERIFNVLEDAYSNAGLDTDRSYFAAEEVDTVPTSELDGDIDPELIALKCHGIHPSPGPLTPDHIVYSGVAPFYPANGDTLAAYRELFSSDPRLLIHEGVVYASGATRSQAQAAFDLAADGAHVLHLTEAFGGANFMTEEQWQFVVNWEAESYRQSVASKSSPEAALN